jgi:uncharacterized membrane protein YgaE (UPF0421/DUF939 family)
MLTPSVLRTAFKFGLAAAIAGTLAMNRQDVQFAWYPMAAVVMCMDETDTRVLAASRTRVLGTFTGGLVGGLVHMVLSGWIGLTVSLVLVVPLLRLLGWQSSRSLGMLVCSMLFLIERYTEMNWLYVGGRILDTLIGIGAVLVVSFLFWPVDRLAEIHSIDAQLRRAIAPRLAEIRRGLKEPGSATEQPSAPLVGSRLNQRLAQLVGDELRSAPYGKAQRQHWRQRQLLWERIHHHSLQVERLARLVPTGAFAGAETPWLDALPAMLASNDSAAVPPLPRRQSLMRLATSLQLPPLLLLALNDELQRLVRSLHSLALAGRRDGSA